MKEIILNERAGIGPCMDVKSANGKIYAIQSTGRLCVLNPDLSLDSFCDGLGNLRQIEIFDNIAVITARENGVWICDLSQNRPQVLSHYHSVEYATGVALYGKYAFISCRQYGVEILDISDCSSPKHVGIIPVGEVQSACVDNGILYAGIWGEKKVVIVDLKGQKPCVISEIALDGRGDGVFVFENILYAATGQNPRGIKNENDVNDVLFGCGNGVEVYDVADPARPEKINARKFEKAYCICVDMWEPCLYGDKLLVNNSVLGVFGLCPETLDTDFRIKPEENDAVTGITALNGDLFVATAFGDLFAVRGLDIQAQKSNKNNIDINIPLQILKKEEKGGILRICYKGDFPVLKMAEAGERLVLACAEGGVRILEREKEVAHLKTQGHAKDVCVNERYIFVAEGTDGVEIFDLISGLRVKTIPENVNQLSVNGRYLLCAIGKSILKIMDVNDEPRELYSYKAQKGQLYGDNFAKKTLDDGTFVLFCHRDGLIFTNPKYHKEFFNVEYIRKNSFCAYCGDSGIATNGKEILYTLDGGVVKLSLKHKAPFLIDEVPVLRSENPFKGLIFWEKDEIVVTNRTNGDITVLKNMKTVAQFKSNTSPAGACFVGDRIYVAGGRMGLIEISR